MNKLAYSIPEASTVSGTGRTSIYEEIKAGRLRAVKRGRRTLILVDDLRAWMESLPRVSVPSDQPSDPRRYGRVA